MQHTLTGKRVLITQADEFMGPALCEVLAEQGAEVVASTADLAPPGAAAQVVAQAVKDAGPLDVLVANAGIGHVGTLLTTSVADFERLLSVNVVGVLRTLKAWMPGMVERKRGSVVVTGSTAGVVGLVDRFAYTASKHAGVGMMRCAALDHATTGVRVNAVCPGRVETPFVKARLREYPDPAAAYREMASTQAQRRMGTPEEVANAALFLASDEASFVTGAALAVDGGWTAGMFPQQ
jgi:NAD(P)-dependent dehydrogenase (short-subunit alcohol dehydrogenase family)